MRAVEVSKRIGITSQELRHELEFVNFGVKPTDRDIPDVLAMGIVRFLRQKYTDRTPLIDDKIDAIKEDDIHLKKETEPKEISQIQEKAIKIPAKVGMRQSIENIRFYKLKIEEDKDTKKDETQNVKEDISKKTETHAKKTEHKEKQNVFKKEPQAIETHRDAKKHKDETYEQQFKIIKKPKKRIKITHKLTLDDVQTDERNVGVLEETMIEREMEREWFRDQKKKKLMAHTIVKKEEKEQKQIKAKTGTVTLPAVISVKEFAEKTGIQVPKVISELMKNGIFATINQEIDYDTAVLIAAEFGVEVKKEIKDISSEEFIKGDLQMLLNEDQSNLIKRSPIVTIMGHVDHGKTQLLDTIRNTNVVAQESGGITQHIGAYQVNHKGHKITFIDTPGHEAFTAMRARGAKVTDIVILVIAADEGMKPQTVEALHHAKEAKVPIIVAVNKIDKEGANIDRVKSQLAEHELIPEDWGGKTIVAPVSAITGEGIDHLLEMVLLISEMENLKANPNRPAIGTVIEANLDPSLGPVATIIINTGTLKIMDSVVVGATFGRIKIIKDYTGKNLNELFPSGVAQIAGLNEVPIAGDILQVLKSEKAVKQKLQEIMGLKEQGRTTSKGVLMDEIIQRIHSGRLKALKLIVKADTNGSLEAITVALSKIQNEEVMPKIIHAGIGDITETDVMMASASGGLVLGFHVSLLSNVASVAEKEGVECKLYSIIYNLVDDVKKILSGLLSPELIETVLGHLEILEIFLSKKKSTIAGGRVTDGVLKLHSKVRIKRKEDIIGEGEVINLKRIKDDVKEVKEGYECGIQIETDVKMEVHDVIEGYSIEERQKNL